MQGSTRVSVLFGVVGIAGITACGPTSTFDGTPAAEAQVQTLSVPKISLPDFRRDVIGKTMAEVRAKYGVPNVVTDVGPDGTLWWSYQEDAVPVYDPDSGAFPPLGVDIVFDAYLKTAIDAHF